MVAVGVLVLMVLIVETRPKVGIMAAATPEDVRRAKDVVKDLRALTERPGGPHRASIGKADIESAMALVARAVPLFRGEAFVQAKRAGVVVSVRIPRVPTSLWLNMEAAVRPSERGLDIILVRLGQVSIPPWVVLPVGGFALDALFGRPSGTIATTSIDGVSIEGDTVSFGVNLTASNRRMLSRRIKNRVRWLAGYSRPENVSTYIIALEEAVRRGRLKKEGSLTPHLRFLIETVNARATHSNLREEVQTALFALAIYCGHASFQQLVGEVDPGSPWFASDGCRDLTLGGRPDLRKHFVVSAGLKAASDAGFAFAIGEFKELYDSGRSSSGFSFDDLAADRAGIRFAAILLDASPRRLQQAMSRLVREADYFPNTRGLDVGLSDEEFVRKYLNIESPVYKRVVSLIDRRIDGLVFFSSLTATREDRD